MLSQGGRERNVLVEYVRGRIAPVRPASPVQELMAAGAFFCTQALSIRRMVQERGLFLVTPAMLPAVEAALAGGPSAYIDVVPLDGGAGGEVHAYPWSRGHQRRVPPAAAAAEAMAGERGGWAYGAIVVGDAAAAAPVLSGMRADLLEPAVRIAPAEMSAGALAFALTNDERWSVTRHDGGTA